MFLGLLIENILTVQNGVIDTGEEFKMKYGATFRVFRDNSTPAVETKFKISANSPLYYKYNEVMSLTEGEATMNPEEEGYKTQTGHTNQQVSTDASIHCVNAESVRFLINQADIQIYYEKRLCIVDRNVLIDVESSMKHGMFCSSIISTDMRMFWNGFLEGKHIKVVLRQDVRILVTKMFKW